MRVHPALLAVPTLLLAACGEYEDASVEAQADTVEIPANEPLQNVTATPVADPNANTDVPVDEPLEESDTEGADDAAETNAAAEQDDDAATAAEPAPDE